MNITEAEELVQRIAMIDNRQRGESVTMMWFELVGDLDFADAWEAVRRHRRNSTDYLMPVHVVQGVKAIRRERYNARGGESFVVNVLSFCNFRDDDEYRAAKYRLTQDVLAGRHITIPKELEA